MKLMRALLLGSMLFVLITLLVMVFGVRAMPESLPGKTGQAKVMLLSSGGYTPTPLLQFNEPVELASLVKHNVASDYAADAPVEAPPDPVQPTQPVEALPSEQVTQTALPTLDVQVQATPLFQPLDSALDKFARHLIDGQANQVVGVYVKDILQLEVDQQPPSDPLFVNPQFGVATQFGRAALNGVIGLLAHNTSSGILFYQVKLGDQIEVVYGDDHIERYQVKEISEFQKLETMNPMSDFIDLADGSKLSSTQVFNRFYNGDHRLTLQTCLEHKGDPNWGLHFIEAYPVP